MTNQHALQAAYNAGLKAGLATKTLDLGAALKRLDEIQDKFDDTLAEYRNLAIAVVDSFSRGGFGLESTLDADFRDQLDTPRVIVFQKYEEMQKALENFHKALEQAANEVGGN